MRVGDVLLKIIIQNISDGNKIHIILIRNSTVTPKLYGYNSHKYKISNLTDPPLYTFLSPLFRINTSEQAQLPVGPAGIHGFH